MGEAELAPGVDGPVAVAPVDGLDGRAVRPGKILVEVGRSPQGLQGCAVAAVLPVEGDAAHGYVVVTGRGAVVGVLAPVAVLGLLLGSQPVEGPRAELFPLLVGQNPSGEIHSRGKESIVIGGGPNVRSLVPGEVDAIGHLACEPAGDLLKLTLPAEAALVSQVSFEQAKGIEQEMNFPLVI